MAGFRYLISRSNIVLSTTVSTITIIPAAARHFRLVHFSVIGMGTASAANELVWSKVNAAGAGASTALTPRPLNPNAPAAALTAAFVYATTEPTLSYELLRGPFNANGGAFVWNSRPGIDEIEVAPGTTGITLRSTVGASNASFNAIVEEL